MANVVKISIGRLNPVTYTSGKGLKMQTILGIFATFAQTLTTAILILYRIVTITRNNNLPKQTYNTYKSIIDLVMQSSAIYSLVSLIWAISWVIAPESTGALRHNTASELTKFIEEVAFIVAVRHSKTAH